MLVIPFRCTRYIGVVGRMATPRPTVTPGKFSGEESWDQWIFHFESAAEINKWDAATRLQWLKVSLTGRALAAFQRLAAESVADYKTVKETLQERFEPSCRRERYQTELQTAKRKKEGWADLTDRLRTLAQKGYPDLEDKAKEQLALNVYLSLIDNSQVAFAVRQRRPDTLDAAVSATLQIECYVEFKPHVVGGVASDSEDQTIGRAGTSPVADVLKQLADRLERLETRLERGRRWEGRRPKRSTDHPLSCWNCGDLGHIAHCRVPPKQQGKESPSMA